MMKNSFPALTFLECIKLVFMKKKEVEIDFKRMETAMREYVLKKALDAGSTIVYREGENIIEEDPSTLKKTILRKTENFKGL
jgi:hypothetical protein